LACEASLYLSQHATAETGYRKSWNTYHRDKTQKQQKQWMI